jgi:hypothetical protein
MSMDRKNRAQLQPPPPPPLEDVMDLHQRKTAHLTHVRSLGDRMLLYDIMVDYIRLRLSDEGELLDLKQGWIAPEPVACPACDHPVTEHRAALSRGDGEWCDYGEWYVGCRKECDCRDWRRRTPSMKERAVSLGWEDVPKDAQERNLARALNEARRKDGE